MTGLRKTLKKLPGYNAFRRFWAYPEYLYWQVRGKPQHRIPHLLKEAIVKRYARDFGLKVLVETGTYYGDMVNATQDLFQEIYTIEIDSWLHQRAQREFARRSHIHLLLGDSKDVLSRLMPDLRQPALFWLDGHFCGGITGQGDLETPILGELECIFRHPVPGHVLLIDDAKWFNGTHDYPTLDELKRHIEQKYPGRRFELADDVIRIHHPRATA